MPALLTRTSIGPAASTAWRMLSAIGDIEGEDAEILRTRQNVFARFAHRGDDLPVVFQEIPSDLEAEPR